MTANADAKISRYPPGYHFWRTMILFGGAIVIAMHIFIVVLSVLYSYPFFANWRDELGPLLLLVLAASIFLLIYPLGFTLIVLNRLPRRYRKVSIEGADASHHKANS